MNELHKDVIDICGSITTTNNQYQTVKTSDAMKLVKLAMSLLEENHKLAKDLQCEQSLSSWNAENLRLSQLDAAHDGTYQ